MSSKDMEQKRIVLNMLKSGHKLTLILFVLVTVFLFCNTWKLFGETFDGFNVKGAWKGDFQVIVRFIITLHCACDVFVYGIMNQQFMTECIALIKHLSPSVRCSYAMEATSDDQ